MGSPHGTAQGKLDKSLAEVGKYCHELFRMEESETTNSSECFISKRKKILCSAYCVISWNCRRIGRHRRNSVRERFSVVWIIFQVLLLFLAHLEDSRAQDDM